MKPTPLPQKTYLSLLTLYSQGAYDQLLREADLLQADFPRSFKLHNLLGACYAQRGKLEDAARAFKKAIKINPDVADTYSNLGNILMQQGHLKKALEHCQHAIALNPNHADAHNNLANILKDLGRLDDAQASYARAIKIQPSNPDLYNNRGVTLKAMGRFEDAIKSYSKALQLNPRHAMAHFNLGNIKQDQGHSDKALAHYKQALKINPAYAQAHGHSGNVFFGLRLLDQAIASYRRAITLKPDFFLAHYNLGNALNDKKRLPEAIESYKQALACEPNSAMALSQKLHIQAQVCNWDTWQADQPLIKDIGVDQQEIPPFTMLAFEDNPARHRARSKLFALKTYSRPALPAIARPTSKPKRLRIGYFSSDFYNHATMFLVAKMFALHDQSQFEIHVFSYGLASDDMRERLTNTVEHFHDVKSLTDQDIAQFARDKNIDIAVDLKGFTGQTRLNIFAYKAAPIQVTYLGYPGTLDTPYIDYIVADPVLIPKKSQRFYAEKIIYLPHSYQVNDNSRPISEKTPSRAALGLPEKGFVFACFNKSYKISPEEFDIWMRLLSKVEGSVLWLMAWNPWVAENLRKEAKKRSIDPSRLIFAEQLDLPDHLARHRAGDLFLDTFNVNAHTTASDALWAGLPLVTKMGEGFAARVAASLLTALELPALITTDNDAYYKVALALATNQKKLATLKKKLAEKRESAPLFDTERFTKNMERAYQQIYDHYFAGEPPQHLWVKEPAASKK